MFYLEDDDIITSISAQKMASQGFGLQIVTSNRTSPLYGEKATEKGRESFTLAVSDPRVFNGFMGNFNNMAGIGIKYYSKQNTSQPVVQVQGSIPLEVSASVNIYTGQRNSGPVVNNLLMPG